jgi:hydroxymethylglutaryl-CoA reductase
MKNKSLITGFSKLSKDDKLRFISEWLKDTEMIQEVKSFWHNDEKIQKLLDEFSENTITNFPFPFGVAPNFLINDKEYLVPMVIEESSVIAAAANSAKFWFDKGGFQAEVLGTKKIGQVHFLWKGDARKFEFALRDLKEKLIRETYQITANMKKRGGGILDIEIVDMTHAMPDYYQLKATFDTRDSMGANFINSCLEEFAFILKDFFNESEYFTGSEKECTVIMSILSNYTPECLVNVKLQTEIKNFAHIDQELTAEQFVDKFEKAVRIAQVDVHRATTHNKGIFNGIDAIALATGNDFRAIEACGHTYAARDGQYKSLTDIDIQNGIFTYNLDVPLSLGTVGGLTSLHPLAKFSLRLLDNPGAEDLMKITAAVGMANNFGALKSLVTKGIQKGHMKMHLMNILNSLKASDVEKKQAVEYFKHHKVSYSSVQGFLEKIRVISVNK